MSEYKIRTDFPGANLRILGKEGDVIRIAPENRDTDDDWFYWCFALEGAEGKTLTFDFGDKHWVGYFGAAVSTDYKTWRWSGEVSDTTKFSYTFGKDEKLVYFAHDILYRPEYFFEFAKRLGLGVEALCRTNKGRDIPCFSFGSGDVSIVLTSRHHACESTGTYVLEGVVEELLKNPIERCRFFCVPMVDYDGVCDGDQGKNRRPHDQNRDYGENPIYESTKAIMAFCEENDTRLAFDFHSPWHFSGENDWTFIVQKSHEKEKSLNRFGEILESCITKDAFRYEHKHDHGTGVTWNKCDSNTFIHYVLKRPGSDIALTLETAYFGEKNNIFTPERGRELGRCFARALKLYIEETM